MEKEKALRIWDAIFGRDKQWACDFTGTWIYREDYGDTEKCRVMPNSDGKLHSFGWEIDHIRPKSDFGDGEETDFLNNFEPMHWQNNRDKADSFPHFTIGDKQYRVVKCWICGNHGLKGYGIIDESGKRVDWKGVQENCFTNE